MFLLERGDHAFESSATCVQPRGPRRASFRATKLSSEPSGPSALTRAKVDGAFFWNERVSQVVTLYKLPDGSFEVKEYALHFHDCSVSSKGVAKRGARFATARVDLSQHAAARTGMRVSLPLTSHIEGAPSSTSAGGMVAVVSIGCEPIVPSGAAPPSNPSSPPHTNGANSDDDDDDENDDVASPVKPMVAARAGGAAAAGVVHVVTSRQASATEFARLPFDDEGDGDAGPALGAGPGGAKPLPPPPSPTPLVAKPVQWIGAGATSAASTTRALAAACCCRPREQQEFEVIP